jgi:hypothetical protein
VCSNPIAAQKDEFTRVFARAAVPTAGARTRRADETLYIHRRSLLRNCGAFTDNRRGDISTALEALHRARCDSENTEIAAAAATPEPPPLALVFDSVSAAVDAERFIAERVRALRHRFDHHFPSPSG